MSEWLDENGHMRRAELYEWCAINDGDFDSLWDDLVDIYCKWCEDTETEEDVDE